MLNGSNSIGAAISESISVSVVKRFLYESCIIALVSSESLFWNLSSVNCRNRSSGNGPEPIQTLVPTPYILKKEFPLLLVFKWIRGLPELCIV